MLVGWRGMRLLAALLLCMGCGAGKAQTRVATGEEAKQALALEQQGQWKDAEAAWRKVLAGNPRDGMATAHLGLVLARETDYTGAVEEYRRALKLDPKMQGLQLDLGLNQRQIDYRIAGWRQRLGEGLRHSLIPE